MKNHFTVIIPSYNVEKWAQKNILSVLNQNYDNYNIIYIDDASDDNTHDVVKRLISEHPKSKNTIFIKNSFNRGKMHNVYEAIKQSRNDTIVVIVDGDDWLVHKNALNTLNRYYSDTDIWMTAGSYIESDSKRTVTPDMSPNYWIGNIRKKSWQASHLGSFRKALFCKIRKKDFMKKTGEWFTTTSDQAIMWPMLEMAGKEHFRVVKEVLYVYNRFNPLSDDRVFREDQLQTENIIRNLKSYEVLDKLF